MTTRHVREINAHSRRRQPQGHQRHQHQHRQGWVGPPVLNLQPSNPSNPLQVHERVCEVLLSALRCVPGGYVARRSAGDLKYLACFYEAEDALQWCLLVGVFVLMGFREDHWQGGHRPRAMVL